MFPKPKPRARSSWARPIRRHKFGANRVKLAGFTFDSGLERDLYLQDLDKMNRGEFANIKVKDLVILIPGLLKERISLNVDYKITNPDNSVFWQESKGFPTEAWSLKRRLWIKFGPGPLEVWMRSGKKGLYLAETIFPKYPGGCPA